jgi:hypothetical protein
MAFIMRALRGNAHVMNYALLGGATLVPVVMFSLMRSPTQAQVELALVRGAAGARPSRGAAGRQRRRVDAGAYSQPPSSSSALPPTPSLQLEDHGDSLSRGRQQQTQINAFWRTKKSSPEMEEIYHGLLRSGKSSVKRHYELTGALADEEARQNPEYARIQALLTLPGDEEPSVGATAAPPAGAQRPLAPVAASHAQPAAGPAVPTGGGGV